MAKGQWESGAHNPSRIRAMEGTDDSAERMEKLRAADVAFAAAMAAAPEGQTQPAYVVRRSGTNNPHRIAPPVTAVIRSSGGW